MDAGVVAEIGPPSVLLADPNSAFSSLVDKTGEQSAAALRKMAADFQAERKAGVQVRGGALHPWLRWRVKGRVPGASAGHDCSRRCKHPGAPCAHPAPTPASPRQPQIGFNKRPSLDETRRSLDAHGRPKLAFEPAPGAQQP